MPRDCLVCSRRLHPHFDKNFAGLHGLGLVSYDRCEFCGFVSSRTHGEMTDAEWFELNAQYHTAYRDASTAPTDDPRWLGRLRAQAAFLKSLCDAGVLTHDLPWVDYGCGDGRLAEYLGGLYVPVLRFDPYVQKPSYLTAEQLKATNYSVVLNTSVFEHVRSRAPLDEMAGLVGSHGVFAIHTLVREQIPADPGWFYLLPVHCAFFTNRSMQLLFEQWGFHSSLYHVPSRLWLWFRGESYPWRQFLQERLRYPAGEIYYKDAFADYWK